MKKTIILVILIILFIPISFAADLSEYPNLFLNEGKVNAIILIGDNAATEDVIGAINIATKLQFYATSEAGTIAMLASEIDDVYAQNTIIVGGPCANSAAANILEFPEDCNEGFIKGRGTIKLFSHDNGNYAILVAGRTPKDTRRAARVLANSKEYDLIGIQKDVHDISTSSTIIN